MKWSVIKQKGKSQDGGNKKTAHSNFLKNEHFLASFTDTYECVSGVNNACFSENLGVLCLYSYFHFEILPLALLPTKYEKNFPVSFFEISQSFSRF